MKNKINFTPFSIGILSFIAICFILVAVFIIAPFFNTTSNQKQTTLETLSQKNQVSQEPTKEGNLTNEEMIQKNIDFIKNNLETLAKENNITKKTDNFQEQNANVTKELPTLDKSQMQTLCQRSKPQLAIIIDDVANKGQLDRVLGLPFKVTPSLFPRSEASKNTPYIAKNAPFYMVHLPLEAKSFYQKEHKWLFVGDSREKIKERIQEIKRDFPNLTYLNNHTGSKFTEDWNSMQYLLEALQEEQIIFVDSKTTGKSVTSQYYKDKPKTNPCLQRPFLQRDVFLDNELEEEKIAIALKNAIKIAKQKGYAIAIGHPHSITIKTLKNMQGVLEKSGVEMVYVNELITKYDTISKK